MFQTIIQLLTTCEATELFVHPILDRHLYQSISIYIQRERERERERERLKDKRER